jgi:SAM-dependent methyltransferase
MENAVPSVIGVDGAYVERSSLLIDEAQFRSFDLAQPFDLGDTFDLVVSLEVAEHLAAQHAAGFVDNLVRHGRKVLFSAATPGQGGEFHVNEQPLQYWREHFAARGFQCFDPLRSRLSTENRVEPWYRYNSLLYVREDAVSELPEVVQATRIPEGTPIPDVAPVSWRARNAVLRTLPRPLVEALAKLKHEWVRQKRRKELADAP